MAKSGLRLDTRRPLKDGTYPVQIRVGYGTNLYLPTGVYLTPDEWDARLQIATGRQARAINNALDTMLLRVTSRILELREDGRFDTYSPAQLRQMLTDLSLAAPVEAAPLFRDIYERAMERVKAENTRLVYRQALGKVGEFCDLDRLRTTDMDGKWFGDFRRFLEARHKPNTVAMHLSKVRAALRQAEDEGIKVNPAYLKVSVRGKAETPLRALPVDTMRRIRDMELPPKTARYRDAFMLSFYLIGINAADLLVLPKDCIVNGRLNYRRAKTGKLYSIKVQPEAQEIIDRYRGKSHLVDFGSGGDPLRFTSICNRMLRSIEPKLSWYWARYSWANYAVDLDIPKDTISEALGHSHGAAVTGVYIKYSLDKTDAANRAVLDYLAQK